MAVAGELTVEIRQLQRMDEAHTCAAFMSSSEPWVTLRRSYEDSIKMLVDPAREVYVATVGQEVAVLSRLPDPLGPNLAVELTRVQSVVTKPQEGFLVATGASDPVGSVVCDLDGNPLGMLDALMVPTPEANFRNALSLISVVRDLPKSVGRGFARPAVF